MRSRMTIKEMINLCFRISGIPKNQVQIVSHQTQVFSEYINFYNLFEKSPRFVHRIQKIGGNWRFII